MNAPFAPSSSAAETFDPTRPEAGSIADLVVERGLVGREGMSRARLVQQETGEGLVSVLTRLGLVSERALARAAAEATGAPLADAGDYAAEPGSDLVSAASPRFLREVKACPLRLEGEAVAIAFADPFDAYPVHALAVAYGRPVRRQVGLAGDIEAALDRAYGPANAPAAETEDAADEADLERLKDLTSDAPAIRAVNRLIGLAVERRASDIHLEPTDAALHVRMRVDGVMQEEPALPPAMRSAVVSRIKVMAGLNIAERRLPQDGRMRLTVRGHDIDLRVATSPTIHGEAVVLRLLDRSNLSLDFTTLGFGAGTLGHFRSKLAQPHGITLVTGPTGSGKTTTLYAALSELNAPERKLLTIEDPIEYRLPGVNQTQVAPGIGLTFAAALRSFLRQDPDIMMVGEIRDLETAQVAVQAALTGHMILSTLHTNSAAAAVTRLLDMGVEPFLITSTLNGVLGQRLVRRLCPHCREPIALEGPRAALGQRVVAAFRPVGCQACGGAGYRGRVALTEFLGMDETISRLVLARAEAGDVEAAAVRGGMQTMLEDGAEKVSAGLTSVEEVLRVTRET